MSKVQFIVDLLRTAFGNCNAEVAKYKAIAADASAQASALTEEVKMLKAALENNQVDSAKTIADSAAAHSADLETIAAELQNLINPSLGSDAVTDAVKESPAVETPAIVEAATEVGQPVETPPAVVEAAIEAVVEVAESAA
jgi:hypothetical protein